MRLNCYWCRDELGRFYANIRLPSGQVKPMHQGLARDCVNEFNKWIRAQQNRQQLQLIRRE